MKITKFFHLATCLFFIAVVTSCSHKTVPAASKSSPANNNTTVEPGNNAPDLANLQEDILANINQYRQSIGLSPLQLLNSASAQATKHSTNMANKRIPFGHTGFEARAAAISKSLGSTVSAAAENVAVGQLTAKQVVAGWLHSPGHKKNITGNFTYTGIGYAVDPGGIIYFTQIFIKQ